MEELENEISTQAEENTVSLASAQALADALAKIEVYTPTTWVDNSSPDIDAEHLNKPEQAIKRVTDALNSAVDVIKDLQSQITKNSGAISDVNNNLSNSRKIVQVTTDDHGFSLGYDADNGLYTLVDLTRFYLVSKSDLFASGFILDPSTCTVPFSIVNGWNSSAINIPEVAKNKQSILLTIWVYGTVSTGKLDATRIQALIVGQGGGTFTRIYDNSTWSDWA